MGIMDFIRRATSSRKDTLDIWRQVYGAREVKSGARVNYATSIEVTTVLACAGVIADAIATVPLKLFRTTPQGREEAADHPVAMLLRGQMNEWQNSVEFREQVGMHLALVRNAFVFVNRLGDGRISELIPFEPQWVTVERGSDYSLRYKVRPPGGSEQIFSQAQIWHLRAYPNWNGFFASEIVNLAREAIGLAMVTEEAHARLHKNGAQIGGLYSVEGTLTKEQQDRLATWLEQEVQGVANSSKTLILDRSAKFTPISMTSIDAQHLETRRFQIEEICRAMHVLPIMVGHYDKNSTYASAEQMFLAHAVHYVRPWHRRIEASANASLLTERERAQGYYFKFLDAELLRGSAEVRAAFYASGITNGWLTRNEVRGYEELNEIEGLSVPLMPLNMADGTDPPSSDTTAEDNPQDPAPPADPSQQ
ncbi:MAG: phage portal protein [Reyranellaceae bacterium]